VTLQEKLDKVTIKDIAAAIEVIKAREAGLPNDPRAMTWCIQFQEVAYPTNSVLALAVKSATGETFVPDSRKGGKQAIRTLEQMLEGNCKFKVVFRQRGSTTPRD
jgi:hypothetical protein